MVEQAVWLARMRCDYLKNIAGLVDSKQLSVWSAKNQIHKASKEQVSFLGVADIIFLLRLFSGEEFDGPIRTVDFVRIPAYNGQDYYWFVALEGSPPKCWAWIVCQDSDIEGSITVGEGDFLMNGKSSFTVRINKRELNVVAGKRIDFGLGVPSKYLYLVGIDEINARLDTLDFVDEVGD